MGPVRTGALAVRAVFGLALAPAMVLASLLALALVLAGCDSEPEQGAVTATSASKTPRKAVRDAGDPDMVTAFSATRGPGLVDLKFKLTKRPAVGEPVEIELALTPSVALERLFARFQAADGLQIVSGAETDQFERPAAGVPVKHKMTVTAKADGIFYVTAVVLADSDKESVARSYSFPLIAGQGLAEAPAAPPAASTVAEQKPAASQP